MSGGKRVDFTRESGLNTESATSVRSLLMSLGQSSARWSRPSGCGFRGSSPPPPASAISSPRGPGRGKLGSVDEPLGSPAGVQPWVISLLVLLLVELSSSWPSCSSYRRVRRRTPNPCLLGRLWLQGSGNGEKEALSHPLPKWFLIGLAARLLIAPFFSHYYDGSTFMVVGAAVAHGGSPYSASTRSGTISPTSTTC